MIYVKVEVKPYLTATFAQPNYLKLHGTVWPIVYDFELIFLPAIQIGHFPFASFYIPAALILSATTLVSRFRSRFSDNRPAHRTATSIANQHGSLWNRSCVIFFRTGLP